MNMSFVTVENLSKNFEMGWLRKQRVQAVAQANFSLDEGEVLAMIGPNGSGKSTLLKILSTLILPTSGNAAVGGFDVVRDARRAREVISLVTNEDRSFFWRMSCYENLRFFCILNNLSEEILGKRIRSTGEKLGLSESLHKRYDQCSTGIKRRLAIARALLSRPRLLMLDEPTNSLDPESAKSVRQIILEQVQNYRTTVIYITHHLEEIEDFPASVAVMKDGIFTYLKKRGVLERHCS